MVSSIVISLLSIVGMIVCVIFFPILKIGKKIRLQTFYFAPLIGALILIIFRVEDVNKLGQFLVSDSSINPLKLLVIFLSMVFVSIVLDEVGFFKFIASIAIKKAKRSQEVLFLIVYLLVSVLTVFTSNDIIILTFTPFIIFFSKRANIDPIPYLVGEFVASNTWSMLLIIGNPTNIYLASSFNIGFGEYVSKMWFPTLVTGLVSFCIMFAIFYNKLRLPIKLLEEVNSGELNNNSCDKVVKTTLSQQEKILDKYIFIVSIICLVVTIILLSISSFIGLEMWIVTLSSFIILFLFVSIYVIFKKDKRYIFTESIKKVPYNLIPFLLSMFVIVQALTQNGVVELIFNWIGSDLIILKYGLLSFISANLVNNIPMTILFEQVLENAQDISLYQNGIFASIIGSNIAAYFTPIGALAGMMFMNLVKNNDVKYSFVKFSLYGLVIAIPSIFTSLGCLLLIS